MESGVDVEVELELGLREAVEWWWGWWPPQWPGEGQVDGGGAKRGRARGAEEAYRTWSGLGGLTSGVARCCVGQVGGIGSHGVGLVRGG